MGQCMSTSHVIPQEAPESFHYETYEPTIDETKNKMSTTKPTTPINNSPQKQQQQHRVDNDDNSIINSVQTNNKPSLSGVHNNNSSPDNNSSFRSISSTNSKLIEKKYTATLDDDSRNSYTALERSSNDIGGEWVDAPMTDLVQLQTPLDGEADDEGVGGVVVIPEVPTTETLTKKSWKTSTVLGPCKHNEDDDHEIEDSDFLPTDNTTSAQGDKSLPVTANTTQKNETMNSSQVSPQQVQDDEKVLVSEPAAAIANLTVPSNIDSNSSAPSLLDNGTGDSHGKVLVVSERAEPFSETPQNPISPPSPSNVISSVNAVEAASSINTVDSNNSNEIDESQHECAAISTNLKPLSTIDNNINTEAIVSVSSPLVAEEKVTHMHSSDVSSHISDEEAKNIIRTSPSPSNTISNDGTEEQTSLRKTIDTNNSNENEENHHESAAIATNPESSSLIHSNTNTEAVAYVSVTVSSNDSSHLLEEEKVPQMHSNDVSSHLRNEELNSFPRTDSPGDEKDSKEEKGMNSADSIKDTSFPPTNESDCNTPTNDLQDNSDSCSKKDYRELFNVLMKNNDEASGSSSRSITSNIGNNNKTTIMTSDDRDDIASPLSKHNEQQQQPTPSSTCTSVTAAESEQTAKKSPAIYVTGEEFSRDSANFASRDGHGNYNPGYDCDLYETDEHGLSAKKSNDETDTSPCSVLFPIDDNGDAKNDNDDNIVQNILSPVPAVSGLCQPSECFFPDEKYPQEPTERNAVKSSADSLGESGEGVSSTNVEDAATSIPSASYPENSSSLPKKIDTIHSANKPDTDGNSRFKKSQESELLLSNEEKKPPTTLGHPKPEFLDPTFSDGSTFPGDTTLENQSIPNPASLTPIEQDTHSAAKSPGMLLFTDEQSRSKASISPVDPLPQSGLCCNDEKSSNLADLTNHHMSPLPNISSELSSPQIPFPPSTAEAESPTVQAKPAPPQTPLSSVYEASEQSASLESDHESPEKIPPCASVDSSQILDKNHTDIDIYKASAITINTEDKIKKPNNSVPRIKESRIPKFSSKTTHIQRFSLEKPTSSLLTKTWKTKDKSDDVAAETTTVDSALQETVVTSIDQKTLDATNNDQNDVLRQTVVTSSSQKALDATNNEQNNALQETVVTSTDQTTLDTTSNDQNELDKKGEQQQDPGDCTEVESRNKPVANNYIRRPDIEVDFYRSPTMLSRQILFQKFGNSIRRLQNNPEEAFVWVCAKRKLETNLSSQDKGNEDTESVAASPGAGSLNSNDNSKSSSWIYSLRQLPIHIACESLASTLDPKLRSNLELLILQLVKLYPEGCSRVDHDGKLPLHEAILNNASPQTITLLLMACPKAIEHNDKHGNIPREINRKRIGDNKRTINEILKLGVRSWEEIRDESDFFLKGRGETDGTTIKMAVSDMSSSDENSNKQTTGTSPDPDDPFCKVDSVPPVEQNEEITPMAWEQLEKRAILLERMLTEMYEKNYELNQKIEKLEKYKEEQILHQSTDSNFATDEEFHESTDSNFITEDISTIAEEDPWADDAPIVCTQDNTQKATFGWTGGSISTQNNVAAKDRPSGIIAPMAGRKHGSKLPQNSKQGSYKPKKNPINSVEYIRKRRHQQLPSLEEEYDSDTNSMILKDYPDLADLEEHVRRAVIRARQRVHEYRTKKSKSPRKAKNSLASLGIGSTGGGSSVFSDSREEWDSVCSMTSRTSKSSIGRMSVEEGVSRARERVRLHRDARERELLNQLLDFMVMDNKRKAFD